jgi:hypothetical protein
MAAGQAPNQAGPEEADQPSSATTWLHKATPDHDESTQSFSETGRRPLLPNRTKLSKVDITSRLLHTSPRQTAT